MNTARARAARRGVALAGVAALALLATQGPSGAAQGASPHGTTSTTSKGKSPHGSMSAPDGTQDSIPKHGPLPPTPAASADLKNARKVKEVLLVVRHRVFHDFVENIEAIPGKPFPIGDSDYEATIIDYVPDFAMDIKTGKVVSRTDQANNPAFRIIVREKGTPQDTTWALLDSPPHYARKSMLALQAVRIDFTSGKPLYSKLAIPPGGKSK